MDFENKMDKALFIFLFGLGGMLILIILFVLSVLIISCFPVALIQTMEDGQHTGYVTALDTSGLIWKTTQVYFKTDAQSSQEDGYCVIDNNVKQQLLEAQKSRKLVTLHYDDYLLIGFPLCGVDEIIRSVEND